MEDRSLYSLEGQVLEDLDGIRIEIGRGRSRKVFLSCLLQK